MKKILDKNFWFIFPIIIVSIFQGLSTILFLSVNLSAVLDYIFEGIFQYSEMQVRALIVAVYLQLPALIFWLTIFIVNYKRKTNV